MVSAPQPRQTSTLADAARDAAARGRHREACELAARLRKQSPQKHAGYQIGARSARELRHFDEALALLEDAAARFPKAVWPHIDQAYTLRACGDFEGAWRLAAELLQLHPGNHYAYRIGAIILACQSRFDATIALLREASNRFPADPWFTRQLRHVELLKANRRVVEVMLPMIFEQQRQSERPAVGQPPQAPIPSVDVLPPATKPRRRVVIILGMHRSGTSLIASILSELGLPLGGPLLGPNFANPEGYHEHRGIVAVHEDALSILGASWDSIANVDETLSKCIGAGPFIGIQDRMKTIVEAELSASGATWGFKDPRALRFLPLWQRLFVELDVQPVWILCVRNPSDTASSLTRRDGMRHVYGELLWAEHYLHALRYLGQDIACIVHSDRLFKDGFHQLEQLAEATGFPRSVTIAAARRLFRGELLHETPMRQESTLWIAGKVYDWLKSNSGRAELRTKQGQADTLWKLVELAFNQATSRLLLRSLSNPPVCGGSLA